MIKNEVLKICLDNKNFLDALHLLINEMFDKGKYPVQLKTELIKPIHKNEEIHVEKDYRGISLTSCLSKFINNLSALQNFGGWQAVSLVFKPPSLPPLRYFR